MSDNDGRRLAGIAILSDLRPSELAAVEQSCRWRHYAVHEQIIDRQSDSRDVYFVVSGKVRVVNYALSGREVALDDVEDGGYFGELAALDGRPRSASVMALTDSVIASLPPDLFLKTLATHPTTALKVMARLALVVRNSTDRIMDLSTLAANNRVHADLLRQARAADDGTNKAVIHPIPLHADIASRVSTTRETVARVLNDLARQGIVKRTKDALVVPDVARLQQIVEDVRGE